MPTPVQFNQNRSEWNVKGELDVSALSAVVAVRGDGLVATKPSVGTYDITVKGAQGLRASEILYRSADAQGLVIGTAAFARIASIAHAPAPNQDDVVIRLVTSAISGGAAADNATAATTYSFHCVMRSGRITAHP